MESAQKKEANDMVLVKHFPSNKSMCKEGIIQWDTQSGC